jgi:hypothetical protein
MMYEINTRYHTSRNLLRHPVNILCTEKKLSRGDDRDSEKSKR